MTTILPVTPPENDRSQYNVHPISTGTDLFTKDLDRSIGVKVSEAAIEIVTDLVMDEKDRHNGSIRYSLRLKAIHWKG